MTRARTARRQSAARDLLAPAVVAAGIMVAATIPAPVPSGTPQGAGYLAHAGMYGALAATLLWTWRRRGWPNPRTNAFVIAVAYGVLHEAVQAVIPWRSAAAADVIADAAGAAAVILGDSARRRLGFARRRPPGARAR